MSDAGIPEAVRAFIADHIDSVMELEALLLLQNRPTAEWSAQDVARELRVEPAWVQQVLQRFASRGILSAVPAAPMTYRYDPDDPQMDRAARDLAACYHDRRVTVISLIFSKPAEKLRTFADAFRLRKEKPDG